MSWIIGDGHVHIHPSFPTEQLIQAAFTHFHTVIQRAALSGPVSRLLLLTESAGAEGFATLQNTATGKGYIGPYRLRPTGEAHTLCLIDTQQQELLVVAGKQIVTAEGLEVLALGYAPPFADGKPIQEVLDILAPASCLRVLPWGAGKWLGTRGQLLADLMPQLETTRTFLGDNGNRPFFWPRPKLFAQAASRGLRNLPGSDPLPFPAQEQRAGSFGFYLQGSLDQERPFASLVRLLASEREAIMPYGQTERILPFFKHQLTMQLIGRARRKERHSS